MKRNNKIQSNKQLGKQFGLHHREANRVIVKYRRCTRATNTGDS